VIGRLAVGARSTRGLFTLAPPLHDQLNCPVWKKIVVSGHDVVDEERLGVEQKTRPAPGRRVVESGGTVVVAAGGVKKK